MPDPASPHPFAWDRTDKMAGLLLGLAVGDALGLPRENLGRARAARLFGPAPLRHWFLFSRGMVSDDTEHACLTAQAFLEAPDDPAHFARALAWRLRYWLLALPAGVGLATARSGVKLWLGVPPASSGVFSAGSGPAPRAAGRGASRGQDPDRLRAFVRASTRLTHTDPRAEQGAWLIALAVRLGLDHGPGLSPGLFFEVAHAGLKDDGEIRATLGLMRDFLEQDRPAAALADTLGLARGVTGYVLHTVPVALYSWLRHRTDFRAAVEEVVLLGGDTDTTGALTGALAGATLGPNGIPCEWLDGLWDWPRSAAWMRALGRRLEGRNAGRPACEGPLPLFWPGILPRNLLFLGVVLAHGFRRLLPPY